MEESIKLRPLREVAQTPETTAPWPGSRAYRYEQLANHIAAQIHNGELTPWQQLPREADFAQKHGEAARAKLAQTVEAIINAGFTVDQELWPVNANCSQCKNGCYDDPPPPPGRN